MCECIPERLKMGTERGWEGSISYIVFQKVACIKKKIHLKLKALEWSQHFSNNKSMGIFPNTQGQVTHKSLV